MQEQPELVGRRSCAGRSVGGEMRLPGLDVVLGRSAPAVDILVERLGLSTGEVGDDEAGVSTLGAGLDPRYDALDAVPSRNSLNLRTLFVFGDASMRVVLDACARSW